MSATVLVVDDLPPNIKLLEAKLNSEYYDVLTAKSGFEALDVVKAHAVDIILLDVMMPGMDGFETCRRLKADPHTAHIPVVMVTALSELEARVQGLQAGADDFLTKPINDMALFARIRSLVRVKIMLDELRLRDQTGSQLGMINDNKENPFDHISGARVAIVDDDLVQAKHIINKLATVKDVYTELMSDPAQAMEKILEGNFDLVIISTQLNDMDGLRLCSHIRSHEKVRHVPLLILVDEDPKILVKGFDIGINDYLVIPPEGNEVLARVNTQIKRKRYQDALKSNLQQSVNMAVKDGLTGLYNRRYFDTHCKALIEQTENLGKSLILLVIDIDHFKSVNDTYGHTAGDEILKQLATRVMPLIRLTDLFARYGGEEFVIVLPNTEIHEGREVAERIRKAVEATTFKISAGDGTLQKTICIGVAGFRENDTTETLFNRADKGLYVAKQNGRNQVVFVEE
jgi:two-component system cell cycle response regulator